MPRFNFDFCVGLMQIGQKHSSHVLGKCTNLLLLQATRLNCGKDLKQLNNILKEKALLQSEWVIMGCFSDGLEHTGQDFQAEILLIA